MSSNAGYASEASRSRVFHVDGANPTDSGDLVIEGTLKILKTAAYSFVAALCLQACSSRPVAPSVQDGGPFPSVVGEGLDKRTVRIPEDFSGKATVLLIGYTQRAQFDIDRWILGLLQLESPARIVELPTIAGMAPTILQDVISNGMRSGIPEEDWGSVVTVFISYTFLSWDSLAEELEDPFGTAANDLPLNAMCNTIERNLLDMTGQHPLPETLRPDRYFNLT